MRACSGGGRAVGRLGSSCAAGNVNDEAQRKLQANQAERNRVSTRHQMITGGSSWMTYRVLLSGAGHKRVSSKTRRLLLNLCKRLSRRVPRAVHASSRLVAAIPSCGSLGDADRGPHWSYGSEGGETTPAAASRTRSTTTGQPAVRLQQTIQLSSVLRTKRERERGPWTARCAGLRETSDRDQ
jgi:hypothetical protein